MSQSTLKAVVPPSAASRTNPPDSVTAVVRKPQAGPLAKITSLPAQRTAAKAGMSVSLGLLVWTALRQGRRAMRHHTWAGVAFLAFTAWHMTLYKSNSKKIDL